MPQADRSLEIRDPYPERMDLHTPQANPEGKCQETTPLRVRVREACRLTGIGRSKLYELIAAKEIETIKVGTITLKSMVSLKQFLERRSFG